MGRSSKNSIDKLDEQIKKMTSDEFDDEKTPLLNRKDLNKKIKEEKEVKKTNNYKTKTLKLDEIKKALDEDNTKAKKVTKTTPKKKESSSKKNKRLSKTIIRNKYKDTKNRFNDGKNKVDKVLDDEKEVDKLIKFLTKFFTIFLIIFIVIFILICII